MSRPLLISDCDEVLLHMVKHFAEWIEEAHGLRMALDNPDFGNAVRDVATGKPVDQAEVWPLLDAFFDTEMHRQNLVPGAVEALRTIGEVADIIILTNVRDCYHAHRTAQLKALDIHHKVVCNQGGKGKPAARLVEEFQPSAAVFVDDLLHQHESVAKHAPDVWRLHMVAEPKLAAILPPAPHAHARIDSWPDATTWILDRFG